MFLSYYSEFHVDIIQETVKASAAMYGRHQLLQYSAILIRFTTSL